MVKFTDRYCEQAHRLLAEHGLAPELYYCKQVSSVAELWVVVMGYVDTVPGGDKEQFIENTERAIDVLHDSGFVFGDLRHSNILHVKGGAMLIDFDRAGMAGQAKYPMEANSKSAWAEGTDPNELIDMAHDRFMLDQWKVNW